MLSFSMRPPKYFYDKPLPNQLDPKTVLIYCPHPVEFITTWTLYRSSATRSGSLLNRSAPKKIQFKGTVRRCFKLISIKEITEDEIWQKSRRKTPTRIIWNVWRWIVGGYFLPAPSEFDSWRSCLMTTSNIIVLLSAVPFMLIGLTKLPIEYDDILHCKKILHRIQNLLKTIFWHLDKKPIKHFPWGERLRPSKKVQTPLFPSRKPLNSPIFKFSKFRKLCRKTRSR